tara:strand:- start:310 stop:606 length:297 start_codon:yes stop_codon:yes gene_type:complete
MGETWKFVRVLYRGAAGVVGVGFSPDILGRLAEFGNFAARIVERSSRESSESSSSSEFSMTRSDELFAGKARGGTFSLCSECGRSGASLLGGGDKLEV